MIFRAFSIAASKNRGEKFSGSGPNQLLRLKEPAMSTQHRADGLGQGQPFGHGGQVGGPLGLVGIHKVAPASHLGNRHVVLGKGLADVADAVRIIQTDAGTIGGAIAQFAVGQGQPFRVRRGVEHRGAQANGVFLRAGVSRGMQRLGSDRKNAGSRHGPGRLLQETPTRGSFWKHLETPQFGSFSRCGRPRSA